MPEGSMAEGQEIPMNKLERELRQMLVEIKTADVMHGTKLMKVGDPKLTGRKLDQAIRWAQGRLGVLSARL